MSDLARRHFERAAREGDLSGRVHELRERFREGSLDLERLMLAAYCGDQAAFEALDFEARCELLTREGNTILGKEGPVDSEIVKKHARLGTRAEIDAERWFDGLGGFGPIASAHAAVALAEAALPREDPLTGRVLAYARRWLAKPAVAIDEPLELPPGADPGAHALIAMLSGCTGYSGVILPTMGVPEPLVRSVADPTSAVAPALVALALAPKRASFEYTGMHVESCEVPFRRSVRLGAREARGRAVSGLAFYLPENDGGHKAQRVREISERLRRLDHPYLARLERVEELTVNSFLFVYSAPDPARPLEAWRATRSLDELLAFVDGIAAGLDHAHRKGVVHGALQGRNIGVTPEGSPLIGEFSELEIKGLCGHLSDSGVIIGPLADLAPEVLNGRRDLTAATDVYGLAAVAHWLIAGEYLFKLETVMGFFRATLAQAPTPIRNIRPDVSVRIERALLRALAKRPEDRFPDMASFRAALAAR